MKYLLLFLTGLLLSAPAHAQSTRGGKGEFYLSPVFTDDKSYNFEGGSSARTDTGFGFTLGYAFNFDQKKSLGIEFAWSDQDYIANVQGGTGNLGNSGQIRGTLE